MKLGYIGMGIMGSPMAINLIQAGHDVTVWNRTKDKCNAAVQAGATMAASPQAVAESDAEVIFINVTDTPDVEQVVFGDQGIAAGAGAHRRWPKRSSVHWPVRPLKKILN